MRHIVLVSTVMVQANPTVSHISSLIVYQVPNLMLPDGLPMVAHHESDSTELFFGPSLPDPSHVLAILLA